MRISFEIEGVRQLDRRLTGIAEGVKDFSPELRKSGIFMRDFFGGKVFDTEGGAIKEDWAPLSEPYASWKHKHFPGKGILERTGKMRKSFKKKATKTRVSVWNAVTYFKYHQSRKSRKSNLPRRVMMKLTEGVIDEIETIIHNGLHKRLNE